MKPTAEQTSPAQPAGVDGTSASSSNSGGETSPAQPVGIEGTSANSSGGETPSPAQPFANVYHRTVATSAILTAPSFPCLEPPN